MIVDPTSFTYEYLNNLKFKELQKLSVQFRVNKRWAKKQELIENLLAFKNELDNERLAENNSSLNNEWTNGSLVFKNLEDKQSSTFDKRLTFIIDKNSGPLLSDKEFQKQNTAQKENLINSRETYEIPPKNLSFIIEPVTKSRETYEVLQNKSLLLGKNNCKATLDTFQNGNATFKEAVKTSKKFENKPKIKHTLITTEKISSFGTSGSPKIMENKIENSLTLKNKSISSTVTDVKMLTVPYTKTIKRNKSKEVEKVCESPFKLAKKSLNIKKTSKLPTKINVANSPVSMRKYNSTPSYALSSIKNRKDIVFSKIPKVLNFPEEKMKKAEILASRNEAYKENVKRLLRQRKSEKGNEVLYKRDTYSKVNVTTPSSSINKHHNNILPSNTPQILREINNKQGEKQNPTDLTKKVLIPLKPLKATKMPDFNKIHQKQFEQMDSLGDYLRKKEERIKKLFGTPQPTHIKTPSKTFQFQPINNIKSEVKFGSGNENLKNLKAAQKDIVRNKLPPQKAQTDIKDKNRCHIQGVRTNKRFELQMKLRSRHADFCNQ